MLRGIAGLLVVWQGSAQSSNPLCITAHCAFELAKAALDPNFAKNTACELGCKKVYAEDTTPEKLVYQNCTTTCAVTYESKAGDKFLACAMDNNCVTFPEIPGTCPYKKEHVMWGTSLASLSGEFWQHRGKNALWDCYPCQHIHSMFESNDDDFCAQTIYPGSGPLKAPCWSYTYSYDLYLTNGSVKPFKQTWQLPGDIDEGAPIDIYYNYMGSWHNETWYILKEDKNYVLLGDCSYMMDWIDVGSIVWVRPGHVLTDAENAEIAHVYKSKLGWDYSDFCYDTHGDDNCPTPPELELGEDQPSLPRRFRHRPQLTPEQIHEIMASVALI